MDKKEYMKQRAEMLDMADSAIEKNQLEDAKDLQDKVKSLDAEFDEMKVELANKNVLEDKAVKIEDLKDKSEDKIRGEKMETISNKTEVQYENAWAKMMLGKELSASESEIIDKTNAEFFNDEKFTHTTQNTPTLIPDSVVAGIYKRAEEQYPLWADMKGFSVPGTLTFNRHKGIAQGDAQWYDEPTSVTDEKNEFDQVKLDGKELSKSVTVSWKMKAMSVKEFISFITQELSDRIGVALGYAAYNGDGKLQPTGVKTALNANDESKKQIIAGKDKVEYKDITNLIKTVHSSLVSGSAFYVSNNTVWDVLANIVDANGRPYFLADTMNGGVGNMFGYTVKADAGIPDGEILFGNPGQGAVKNVNAPLTITTDDHAKQRETDYVGYTVVDSNVLDVTAFAIMEAPAIEGGETKTAKKK